MPLADGTVFQKDDVSSPWLFCSVFWNRREFWKSNAILGLINPILQVWLTLSYRSDKLFLFQNVFTLLTYEHCFLLFFVCFFSSRKFWNLGYTWIKNLKMERLINIKEYRYENLIWAPSSEFVSSSIPSWQILTVHAQTFRGARDLAFCLKVPLDSLLVWASSGGSGETARRLAWTFTARIGDKHQIRLTRPIWKVLLW